MKETTARPESAGAPPPADAAIPPATDPTIADRRAARLSRVGDYQTRTLAQEDPLLANLGSINSGLMCVALWLDETIKQTPTAPTRWCFLAAWAVRTLSFSPSATPCRFPARTKSCRFSRRRSAVARTPEM